MTWEAVATKAGAMSNRVLTPDEVDEVEYVLDAAAKWAAGRLPWQQAANVGTWHDSAARTRFLAITTTPNSDVRWHDLKRLLDVLVDASGYVRTKQGVYSSRELGEHDVAVHFVQQERAA